MSFYFSGSSVFEISPSPGIIFHNADPGVPVLAVKAYDDVTNAPLPDVQLSAVSDASYFELVQKTKNNTEYTLKVKEKIDKPVGYVFSFNVYSMNGGDFVSEVISINVTEMNKFEPIFEQMEYAFVVLRNGFEANLVDVGTVVATDADQESYNNQFQYFILDPAATPYVFVDPKTGELELIDNLPPDVKNMTFDITVIDAGSPQRLSSTKIVLNITDLKRKS